MAFTQISTDGIKDGTITGADLATNVDLVDNKKIRFGTGNDLEIYHNGTESWIKNSTGTLNVLNDGTFQFKNLADNETIAQFEANGAVKLFYDNSKKFETRSGGLGVFGHIEAGDNNKLMLGDANDLQIYHDGSNSYIKNAGTGSITFLSDDVLFKSDGGGNTGLTINTDGAVELYYNNSKKFETTSLGTQVT